MKPGRWVLGVVVASSGVLAAAAFASAAPKDGLDRADLAAVRQATVQYHDAAVADTEGGYDLLDVCFDDKDAGTGMGYHLVQGINDTHLDPLRPEALVYEPTADGHPGHLVAVEYIVPMSLSSTPPEVMGMPLHANEGLGLWVLHAWVWRGNPDGVMADFNPNVDLCPEPPTG